LGGKWRGRVLAATAEGLRVRVDGGTRELVARGQARPGDLIAGQGDALVEVVRPSRLEDYPGPEREVSRLAPARIRGIHLRAAVLRHVRAFFDGRGFVEIEAPTLVRSPGMEIEIEAMPVGERFLMTSPEFAMKRLLAAGMERIYSLQRCFRAGEVGSQHQCEFTMLEWYRGYADLESIRRDTEELCAEVARRTRGEAAVRVGDRVIDLLPPWDRMTVSECFHRWAGVELRGDENAAELAGKLAVAGIDCGGAHEWHDLFYAAFLDRIEPRVAEHPRGLFIEDWPTPLAALARRVPGREWVAERFEAYVGGLELANAFGELTDAAEQRQRFEEEQAARRRKGKAVYDIDEKFMAALEEGLPPSAGIALGLDRLAMLMAGARNIRDVCAFAGDEL
jgi:lysyl-tRNA synthetase class 2